MNARGKEFSTSATERRAKIISVAFMQNKAQSLEPGACCSHFEARTGVLAYRCDNMAMPFAIFAASPEVCDGKLS